MEQLDKRIDDLSKRVLRGRLVLDTDFLIAREHKKGVVALHIPKGLNVQPSKVGTLLRGGLKDIATHIEHDDSMNSIRRVAAASWIVTQHPYMMEQLGFHVDTEGKDPEAEEFLKDYEKFDSHGRGPATFAYM